MQYPINEIFETIQGEGVYTGVPAIFIRLQGCPVGCAWCDTRQTWQLDESKRVEPEAVFSVAGQSARWAYLTSDEILAAFKQHQFTAKHLVITGGEPCIYDLAPLTTLFTHAGYQCQIETSGTFVINCTDATWVTVSPKINMKGKLPVLKQALTRSNEIKHPVATEAHIEQLDELLKDIDIQQKTICLQPISQQPRATKLAIDTCIARNWRLSVQMHKYLAID